MRAKADDGSNDEQTLIKIGFQIAPVTLNLKGKDPNLVGLGSFLVNAVALCDDCHFNPGPPNFNEYAAGGNPYFGQHPAKINPAIYLGGGADFGPAGSGTYPGPDIITRNLTPDKTGLPEGGVTLDQFMTILRTGKDFDHLHPTCKTTSPPNPANCIPAPVDGEVLQVMPWPIFQNMTDHQLQAIYTYLSAIPCVEGPAKVSDLPLAEQYAFAELHHDCH